MKTYENCTLEDAILEARKLAEEKLAVGESADEFVKIGEADGFKLYVTAGKTVKDEFPISIHENLAKHGLTLWHQQQMLTIQQ